AGYGERTEQAIRAWRSVHIQTDRTLVERTRARLRSRALELGTQPESLWLLWVSCVLSCVCAAITARYAWQWLSWLAARTRLPAGLLAGAVFLWGRAAGGGPALAGRDTGFRRGGRGSRRPRHRRGSRWVIARRAL